MARRGSKTADDLDRPDGNDLKSNYRNHDNAEEAFISMLGDSVGDSDTGEEDPSSSSKLPSSVELYPIGIDEREDDGKLIYDDNPDLLITSGDGALVDIKSKTDSKWMRLLNERHYRKYCEKAEEYDVPAYVFFYNTNTSETILCRVDDGGRAYHTSTHDFMLSWPDRNNATYLTTGCDVSWGEFINQIIDND